MKTVSQLCKPRESVFLDAARDDVLNLSDFIEKRIDAVKFFSENYKTSGMDILFETAFNRFKCVNNAAGVIRLTQAMGGGKTHCMLALALLAQHPELREQFVGFGYENVGKVRVVAFTGRESDEEFGIWGSIAEQLGKKEYFKDYYQPLKAPGETAWINLLQGEKTLILLDELPPYLENARATTVGNSDLCKVTITALSNLFSAIGKEQLSNVCLVFSDLKATYESGSEQLQSIFKELEQEANRSAINIEPVSQNTDEVYSILKKRLFQEYPENTDESEDVREIALSFKDAVNYAKKSDLTDMQGEVIFAGVRDSYPFHPSIKDLYARFKENQNFQQTRGLIKLMRQIVRQFYESGKADVQYLIGVHDFDLNDATMLGHIKLINHSLENAISHDIANNGTSVAESIDMENKTGDKITYAQNVAKLILMSSLSEANQALLGLSAREIIGYLACPGVEPNNYKQAIDKLADCWYLKTDYRGNIYYQNTKNLVALLNEFVNSYNNEQARKDLRKFLIERFTPRRKTCYQNLYVLPAVDEIEISQKYPTLVIFEPYANGSLHPDLQKFYLNELYKNRVMFLSGQKNLMENLLNNSKKLSAIKQIISNMESEHVPHSDQQYREADARFDKALQALLESIRQTFVTLYYPTKNDLNSEDFKLEFKENSFDGEEQIISLLSDKLKFYSYSTEPDFISELQDRCEAKLFTQKEMQWSQILERAAVDTSFPWYNPNQLEALKTTCLKQDLWREQGGYLIKGPFEKDPTSVSVEETLYDPRTGEYSLKVRANNGDMVYYDVGSDPTTASEVAKTTLVTKEPVLRFICVDSNGEHKTGPVKEFIAEPHLQYEQRMTPNGLVMQLQCQPKFTLRYTTDGSNPKEDGGEYSGDIVLPNKSQYVLVAIYYNDRFIKSEQIKVNHENIDDSPQFNIEKDKPLDFDWKRKIKLSDTESTYRFLDGISKYNGVIISQVSLMVTDKLYDDKYIELTCGNVMLSEVKVRDLIESLRGDPMDGADVVVSMEYKRIHFETGSQFNAWTEDNKYDLNDLVEKGNVFQ